MDVQFVKRAGALLALFSSALLVQVASGPVLRDDDTYYAGIAQQGDLISWLIERYAQWSSRALIDLVTVWIVPHEGLWMVLNALFITTLCLTISALASRHSLVCFNKSALALACFWLIPVNMMHWSVWWLTGSLNYLWPVTAALIYWAVVKYELTVTKAPVWIIMAGLATLLFSVFSEQIMIVNLIVHGFMIGKLRKGYFNNRTLLIGLLITLFGLALFVLSEGNSVRAALSAQYYFPEFADFGVLEKAYFGISLGLYQFFYMGSWVSVVFCLAIALRYQALYAKYIAVVSLFFIMLTSGFMLGYATSEFSRLTTNVVMIGAVYKIEYHQAYTPAFYWAMGLGLALSLALAVALLGRLSFLERGVSLRQSFETMYLYRVLLFVLSFLPTCMLGFSPTMYASEERVMFASTAILILLVVMIVGKTRFSWHVLAATTVMAFLSYWASTPLVF
ncbi:DUF6056 family protein [Halomonas sp. PAMB 3264]|uniref:DUF6056 family protein n=1 Tax=Halomonas sp. PAMB 3264 TaxID=3075222 RepID=UPI002898E75E|nr:DUF6056 family protein [Halomonas sp. PAMB 3264]WNL43450.1 DUF6056 family protein [Halomonas sp. PAMB 3264]